MSQDSGFGYRVSVTGRKLGWGSAWRRFRSLLPVTLSLLAGCGGSLPPPDWKMNTQAGLEAFAKHYLDGNGKLAEVNFAKARAEAGRTGRPDLVARVELARCGVHAAALEFDACPGYAALKDNAGPEEQAYAAFLDGAWQSLGPANLPKQYGPLLKAGDATARAQVLTEIKDPASRLIAAGVLFRSGQLPPAGIATAVDTASAQGWRRPLLAWLGVELKRAEAAADQQAAARLRQRIELVSGAQAAASIAP